MEQESLLKKFIEEENNNNIDSNILDTNSNAVVGTDNIVTTDSDVIATNNGLSQINISLIIGGIALLLIIIIKIISNKQIKNSTQVL